MGSLEPMAGPYLVRVQARCDYRGFLVLRRAHHGWCLADYRRSVAHGTHGLATWWSALAGAYQARS
jgi:hypothetical protein